MAPQAIALWQLLEQLAAEPQALLARADAQQTQGPLAAMDFPAAAIGIQEKMQQGARLEQGRQGGQAGLGLAQVVQYPHRIDVIEGAFALELQQAALLDPHG